MLMNIVLGKNRMKMRNEEIEDSGERKERGQETKAELGRDRITSRTDCCNNHKTKLGL